MTDKASLRQILTRRVTVWIEGPGHIALRWFVRSSEPARIGRPVLKQQRCIIGSRLRLKIAREIDAGDHALEPINEEDTQDERASARVVAARLEDCPSTARRDSSKTRSAGFSSGLAGGCSIRGRPKAHAPWTRCVAARSQTGAANAS